MVTRVAITAWAVGLILGLLLIPRQAPALSLLVGVMAASCYAAGLAIGRRERPRRSGGDHMAEAILQHVRTNQALAFEVRKLREREDEAKRIIEAARLMTTPIFPAAPGSEAHRWRKTAYRWLVSMP